MSLDIILNDLSTDTPYCSIKESKQGMHKLVLTIREAMTNGFNGALRTKSDFYDIVLTSGYPLRKWLNDGGVDRDESRYLRTISQKAPFLEGLNSVLSKDCFDTLEYRFEKVTAEGLGVAYLLDTLAISFPGTDKWSKWKLPLEETTLDEEDCSIKKRQVFVNHASCISHIKTLSEWINSRRSKLISNTTHLYEKRKEFFPNLIFCCSAFKSIGFLSGDNSELRQIKKHLDELNDYAGSWHEGPFQPELLQTNATRESQPTLEKYRKEHTFLVPSGEPRLFSWHVRYTPGPGRIFFIPDPNDHTIIIGYIGRKLPTVLYPA